jgi:hypothetical protein
LDQRVCLATPLSRINPFYFVPLCFDIGSNESHCDIKKFQKNFLDPSEIICEHSFFLSGSVQGSRFGFRVSTGSPGRSCQFFFLNQNNIVLVKKQKSTGCNRVFGQVTPGFSLLYFFFNPLDSSLGSVRSQVDPAGRAGFQNYICESLAFFSTISLYI